MIRLLALENLTGGERPVFDEAFQFSSNGANFALAIAGTGDGRENLDTIYQFDSDPALTAEEQAFNDDILRVCMANQYLRRIRRLEKTAAMGLPAIVVDIREYLFG